MDYCEDMAKSCQHLNAAKKKQATVKNIFRQTKLVSQPVKRFCLGR
jgi:hypothetical protein